MIIKNSALFKVKIKLSETRNMLSWKLSTHFQLFRHRIWMNHPSPTDNYIIRMHPHHRNLFNRAMEALIRKISLLIRGLIVLEPLQGLLLLQKIRAQLLCRSWTSNQVSKYHHKNLRGQLTWSLIIPKPSLLCLWQQCSHNLRVKWLNATLLLILQAAREQKILMRDMTTSWGCSGRQRVEASSRQRALSATRVISWCVDFQSN